MNFKQWERNFDACLMRPDVQAAWRKLVEHRCNPHTLKSALYHAADYLLVAQESSKEFRAYFRIRKNISTELSQLKRELRHLTSLTIGGERMMSFFWTFYRVRREHVVFFNRFPVLLERLESILAVPKAPTTQRNRKRSSFFIASGEAALHIYVKEATRKWFASDTAVLLEGAATAYGIERQPNYSEEAVIKRYRRYQCKGDVDYKLTRLLVKQFVSKAPNTDLHTFINRGTFGLGYNVAMDYAEDQPEAVLRSSWGKLASRLDRLASTVEASARPTVALDAISRRPSPRKSVTSV